MKFDKNNWKSININIDSLWIIGPRAKGGKRENNYHGNFVPQIPDHLIRRYTEPGDIVLEPFMGSGTTLYECESLGRNYIGFDINEEIIRDTCAIAKNIKAISLRYFNPIGAHASALIGELPNGVPQNLIPYITQTAIGLRESLSVYGDDYPTPDGTCIRDYIHVVDLAEAHLAALEYILQGKIQDNYEVFNVGTGKGSSVLEVIKAFEKVTGQALPYKIVSRRAGDVVAAYADTHKVNEVLKWKAKQTLEEALLSAWNWEKKLRNK